MPASTFEAPTLGLGRLLSEGSQFVVPHHQRDYSWTEDELSQFFADVEEARASRAEYYFLGLMVFMPGGNEEYTILDGQQRMATAAIILSSIRTWLRRYNLNRDADQIQSMYIAQRELGEDELTARLVLNEANNDAFHRYVVEEMPSEDIRTCLTKMKRHDPSRTLLEATLFCRKEIEARATKAGSTQVAAKTLFEFVTYLREGVRVVRLVVPTEADAYTVFETLNDRGLDLTVLDLVKNYVFGKAGSKTKLADIKLQWTRMMSTLSNVRGDDFLKAYWTSRYGRTQKAQLFPSIKSKHKTSDKVSQFSSDLLQTSEHYAALELADDPLWAKYSDSAREHIRVLKMLRSNSIHPVILSGLTKFTQRELERLLWLLEVLIVRFQLIGGGRTGLLEIACAKLASEIYEGKVGTATSALHSLKDIYPTDDEFRDAFAVTQEDTNTKVQYLLRRIEIEQRKRRAAKTAPDELEPKTLTVEHIFPKNPGSNWKTLQTDDPQFAEDCTFRLGNMTLLSDVNRDLGQKDFAEKKKTYAKSSLFVTKDLHKFKEWNRDSVETRQIDMAKLAVSVWRFQ